MSRIEVTGLAFYPVKSCAGTEITEAILTPNGIAYDREWMLVDEDNKFVSQRKNPELALVYASVIHDPNYGGLSITTAAYGKLAVPFANASKEDLVEATVHGKPVTGHDEGIFASAWFSEYLNKKVRLIRTLPESPRLITDRYRRANTTNQVGFADGFPLTIASEASLRELNKVLPSPVPMNRFRPNIVVDGESLEPYVEDYWRELRIGDMTAFVVRACARCEIPDTNQATAQRGREVRTALSRTRRGMDLTSPEPKKEMFFMQNLIHQMHDGLVISKGDEVIVTEQAIEPNISLI